ncbi:MAG: MoaD/ThiS family protein [Candidatus Thorarchaeota archaeon]
MTILVKIFGDLRKKVKDYKISGAFPLTIHLDDDGINTISDILKKFEIKPEETYHLFVNSVYSSLDKKVYDGDRVGIFPKNMALLYKWYFKRDNE